MLEIVPKNGIRGEITVPGSKYIANRVLIICSLAKGTSKITNVPDNEDINNAIAAMRNLGVDIQKEGNVLIIEGGVKKLNPGRINVGDSGTLLRFAAALASLIEEETLITGNTKLMKRPVEGLLESLTELGAECNFGKDFSQISVKGLLKGGQTLIRGDVSSQFISALLLVAPYAKKNVKIIIGSELVSKSYVDMTIELMHEFNVYVERKDYTWFKIKAGQRYVPKEFFIKGDWSSANYFLAAAAITGGAVRVKGINAMQKQGEAGFADALVKMGCILRKNTHWAEIIGMSGLDSLDIDMSSMPDSVQTLAAVSCFCNGSTLISNIGHLTVKESNRIEDTAEELKNLGLKVKTTNESMEINGGSISPGVVDSHNDHRMAMSLALIGLKVPGIKIRNPECVNKSFPGFWDKLRELGVEIKNV
jgi:3-phosphoshikimate 1-carboxyvinyltransferase